MDSLEYTPEELLGPLNDVERRNAPSRLYLAGAVELLQRGSRVSVVGSRSASADSLSRTRLLVTSLAAHGITVVSGLAKGIDTAAHETAIREGGRTIAVLGTPLDKVYPKQNGELQRLIMWEHLAVSQFPPGYPSQKRNWPMRNRTMALLTDATVIVAAGEKSGTLHQGWEALRLGRLLFLMESVATDTTLSWPSEMIRYGAQVLSRDNLELFLEEIPERSRGEPVTF